MTAQGLSKRPHMQGPVETFLRGAGVTDEDIGYFRSLIGRPIQFYSCFISYSHADKGFARRLCDALQGRGIRCWLDEKDLELGDTITEHVDRAIRFHDRVVLCGSRTALQSDWVNAELQWTFDREKRDGRNVLIPLCLDGYLLNDWRGPIASKVKQRLAADFTGWESSNQQFEEQFERVVRALKPKSG